LGCQGRKSAVEFDDKERLVRRDRQDPGRVDFAAADLLHPVGDSIAAGQQRVAAARFGTLPSPPDLRRKLAVACAGCAIVYSGIEAISVWPDGIRYVNRVSGGPDQGASILADSNYDWGQGLSELDEWWHQSGEPHLRIWYYGTDPRRWEPRFHPLLVHSLPDSSISSVQREVGDAYFAVSVTLLHDCPDRRPATLETITWLKSLVPVARTRTAFIYKLPRD